MDFMLTPKELNHVGGYQSKPVVPVEYNDSESSGEKNTCVVVTALEYKAYGKFQYGFLGGRCLIEEIWYFGEIFVG